MADEPHVRRSNITGENEIIIVQFCVRYSTKPENCAGARAGESCGRKMHYKLRRIEYIDARERLERV